MTCSQGALCSVCIDPDGKLLALSPRLHPILIGLALTFGGGLVHKAKYVPLVSADSLGRLIFSGGLMTLRGHGLTTDVEKRKTQQTHQ